MDNFSRRYGNGIISRIFEVQEQPKAFFSDYLDQHSWEIGKVIFDGFGRDSNLMGHCEYQNGDLNRIDPIEYKSCKDIGLGKNHLEKGYPNIWNKKEQLVKEILNLNNQISDAINEFHRIINSSFPDKFKAGESIVSEIDTQFLPFYYQRHTFSFLFDQIVLGQDNLSTSKLLSLKDKSIHVNSLKGVIPLQTFGLYRPIDNIEMALGGESDLKEYLSICDDLVTNPQLIGSVKKYRGLKEELVKLNTESYYVDIDNLWKDINEYHRELKGRGECDKCKKPSFLDYL